MKNIELIENEIKSILEGMTDLDIDSEEYAKCLSALAKLVEQLKTLNGIDNDIRRLENDEAKMADEREAKKLAAIREAEKSRRDARDAVARNVLTGASIVVPVAAAVWANIYNWTKEAGGIMTSKGGKNAIDFLTKCFRR